MAKKISREEVEQASAPQGAGAGAAEDAQQAAEDISTLHPDGGIVLKNRSVVVREYGYIEGLTLQAGIKLFLQALYGLFAKAAAPPTAEQVREVFAAHAVTVQWLMAQSITVYPEDPRELQAFAQEVAENAKWVSTLDDIQGDALLAVWWGTNRGFFTRRFRERLLAEREAANRSDPPGSTPT